MHRTREKKIKKTQFLVLVFIALFSLTNSVYPLFSDPFWLVFVTQLALRERRRRPIRRKRGEKEKVITRQDLDDKLFLGFVFLNVSELFFLFALFRLKIVLGVFNR